MSEQEQQEQPDCLKCGDTEGLTSTILNGKPALLCEECLQEENAIPDILRLYQGGERA